MYFYLDDPYRRQRRHQVSALTKQGNNLVIKIEDTSTWSTLLTNYITNFRFGVVRKNRLERSQNC